MDLSLPLMDGWEATRRLKADAALRSIPIIVLSIVDNKDLGYRLGAFDYLMKPFDREAILATLARISPQQRLADPPHHAEEAGVLGGGGRCRVRAARMAYPLHHTGQHRPASSAAAAPCQGAAARASRGVFAWTGDGEPGTQSIWQGYQRLHEFI